MAIRISTSQTFNNGANAITGNQSKVSETQLRLSEGKRILQPSDDPVGAAMAIDLKKQIAESEQFMLNGQRAETALTVEENTLNNVTEILQRIRELTLQAANATVGMEDRQSITVEIERRADELLGLANTQLASGEYLFAGYQSDEQPFTRNATGSVDYYGDQGNRNVKINYSVSVQSHDSGDYVFQDIKTGNGSFVTGAADLNMGTGVISTAVLEDALTYQADLYSVDFSTNGAGQLQYQITGANTGPVYAAPLPIYDEDGTIEFNGIRFSMSGYPADGDSFFVEPSFKQDIFATIDQIVDTLKIPSGSAEQFAQFQNALNLGMQNLDQTLSHVDQIRASVGARLNIIESEYNINESVIADATSTLSLVEDLDYAEAITELNKRSMALQASQQSFVQIQNLSLFEFL